ncbi:MAG: DinB family protein [Pyrinomonadaceae bacterium]
MEDMLEDFVRTVEEASTRLLSLAESEAAAPLAEGKWSAKEVIGHLVDSASNNHQRFVRAQLKEDLVFEGYAQEDWVRVQDYSGEPWPHLVNLWKFYNLHLAHVIRRAPERERLRPRHTHNLQEIGWAPVAREEPATLEHLMRDYVGHLKNHLRQIFDEESGQYRPR